MALQLIAVRFDATDPQRIASFWAELLGREPMLQGGDVLLAGNETQVGLAFTHTTAEKRGPNRVHLHLTSTSAQDQQGIVERAIQFGARHIDIGQRPEEGHIVLADPDDNEFCVIGPNDTFLQGCGEFGEVTCEGSPAIGRFWSHALGWPLVWERCEQTAIQSPAGGTKISWDVRSGDTPYSDRKQILVVSSSDWATDRVRLVALGATVIREHNGVAEMADPDGFSFTGRIAAAR